MYYIELATQKDIPALTDFFAHMYGPKHITTDREYLDWQYLRAPGNAYAPKYPNVLFKKGTAIVGHLGLIPYTFIIHGTKRKGAYCASLIVDEALRSRGAGALLVREAEKYFDILYTTGANKLAQPALQYNDWSDEFFMTRWIYDYSKQGAVSFSDDPHVTPLDSFDKKWDTVWEKLQMAYSVTIDRSSEYLNWRFVNTFKASYTIFGYQNDTLEGYIVMRIEEGSEFKACRIVDFVANDTSAVALFKTALHFGATKNVHFIDFFVFPEVYTSVLKEVGFYIYDPKQSPEPPMMIQPSNRNKLTTNVFYKHIKKVDASIAPNNWYMTKADGDRDRPY